MMMIDYDNRHRVLLLVDPLHRHNLNCNVEIIIHTLNIITHTNMNDFDLNIRRSLCVKILVPKEC